MDCSLLLWFPEMVMGLNLHFVPAPMVEFGYKICSWFKREKKNVLEEFMHAAEIGFFFVSFSKFCNHHCGLTFSCKQEWCMYFADRVRVFQPVCFPVWMSIL